jgi:DNA-binding NarL/FixJ family response regulator
MVIRIVVADDDTAVRDAVVEALAADDRFEVVAAAVDASRAVDAVRVHRPDAVLLDVRMPGGGVAAARQIRDTGLPITITVASARVDATVVADLLAAGVSGIFAKGHLGGSLGDLIANCLAGQVLLLTSSAAEGMRLHGQRTLKD